jgi:hypothetical protein
MRIHGRTLVGLAALGVASATAGAQWVTWEISAGGNGHEYRAFAGFAGLTWSMADELAQNEGAYLATISSSAENAFVFALVDAPQFWNNTQNGSGPALGGFQMDGAPEPAGGWGWITGEPWSYTNWYPGQPDNGGGGPFEDRLHFFSGINGVRAPTWNDLPRDDQNIGGFVVERIPAPPTVLVLAVAGLVARRRGRCVSP